MKMGFPGDIPPPANHSVYLGILGEKGSTWRLRAKKAPKLWHCSEKRLTSETLGEFRSPLFLR